MGAEPGAATVHDVREVALDENEPSGHERQSDNVLTWNVPFTHGVHAPAPGLGATEGADAEVEHGVQADAPGCEAVENPAGQGKAKSFPGQKYPRPQGWHDPPEPAPVPVYTVPGVGQLTLCAAAPVVSRASATKRITVVPVTRLFKSPPNARMAEGCVDRQGKKRTRERKEM